MSQKAVYRVSQHCATWVQAYDYAYACVFRSGYAYAGVGGWSVRELLRSGYRGLRKRVSFMRSKQLG